MALNLTPSSPINFDALNRTPVSVTVTGGLPPYTATSSNTNVFTVAQVTSPNLWTDSDTLNSGTGLFNLVLSTGGPNGAADAEYTGTGANLAANLTANRTISVSMGQSYIQSWWIDPSHVINGKPEFRFFDINGTTIQDTNPTGIAPGSAAGRYATSAWTCPTNIAPHSDDLLGSAHKETNVSVNPTGGPNGASASAEYTGTGSPSAYEFIDWLVTVVPGTTYTLSTWVDPSKITAGNAWIGLWRADLSSAYFRTPVTNGASAGRLNSASWTCPAGVTQVYLRFDLQATVTSGQKMKWSQPMLEPASSASGYYISSQNPQVKVDCFCWNGQSGGFIVANGQKFKISQPMLALSTYDPNVYLAQTAIWNITPQSGGAGSVTFSDSTP